MFRVMALSGGVGFPSPPVGTGWSGAVGGAKPEAAGVNLSQSYLHTASEGNKSKLGLNGLVKLH